ncbi:MAG: DUF1579 family protein [Planctomycetes bacterium]|nr:DUF1579 family protein [Planctomycetota bacterium]
MKSLFLLSAALVAAPFLRAQDETGAPQMPNPKTEAHEVLASLAGHWRTSGHMAAMPGVPGMEEAKDMTGSEHWELVCNGLWLKATTECVCDGEKTQGLWLQGYDPFEQKYTGVWASGGDEGVGMMTGTYDKTSKTFSFKGSSPMGEFRSEFVCSSADKSVETCWMKGEDGKEIECMKITRERIAAAAPSNASAAIAKAGDAAGEGSDELAPFAQSVGEWRAEMTMPMPGQDTVKENATEHVVPICGGKWFWSDFNGSMMGAPFEGHALSGYDAASKQYVSFWIDSMSPTCMKTTGSYDADKKQMTLTGASRDEQGRPIKVREVSTQSNADTRELHMTFTGPEGAQEMNISYRRAKH